MRRPDGVASLLSLQSIPATRKPSARRAAASRAQPQKTSIATGLVVVVEVGGKDEDDGNNVEEDSLGSTVGLIELKAFNMASVKGMPDSIGSTVASDSQSDSSMMALESTIIGPAPACKEPGLIKLQSLTGETECTGLESGVLTKDEEDAKEVNGSELHAEVLEGSPR